MKGLCGNNCSDSSMAVISAHQQIMTDRPKPTDRLTNQQTSRQGHMELEVSLPIIVDKALHKNNFLYLT